jgi:predicted ATPase
MPINSSLVRRVVDSVDASRAAIADAARVTHTAERALGLSFAPGDHVVDSVTGSIGEIVNGYTHAEVVQPARPKNP